MSVLTWKTFPVRRNPTNLERFHRDTGLVLLLDHFDEFGHYLVHDVVDVPATLPRHEER